MKGENTLLAKWLEGSITSKELQRLQQEVDLPSLERVLNRQKKFDVAIQSDEEMWENFEKKVTSIEKTKNTYNRRNWLIGFVLLFIMALNSWLYFKNKNRKKIETAPTKTERKIYADGTTIHISPTSSIEYDEQKWTNERTITLKGQAFFEVEKGNPFIVLTPQGKIEVVGTKFDIWEMEGLMNVQCYEGSVEVTSGGTSITLMANQQIFVNEKRLEDVETIELKQPDWMQAKRVYRKIPLKGVLKDIERFYNVKIDASAVSIENDFGGVIPTNDFDKALNYLTKTLNWTYEIKDDKVFFNQNSE